jgi:hypothetical protein
VRASELGQRRVQSRLRAAADRYARAEPEQLLRGGQTDAGAAAGDDRDLIRE